MEEFKTIEAAATADPRWSLFVRIEGPSFSPLTFADHYGAAADLEVPAHIPEGVKTQLNTAKNLFIYSWYVYGFGPLVDLTAYAALEQALRLRFKEEGAPTPRKAFAKLLQDAIRKGWLQDVHIRHFRRLEERKKRVSDPESEDNAPNGETLDPQSYVKLLAANFPMLRNSLAHGHGQIYPPSTFTLGLCMDLIGQLFVR
jgi:hypothetical protein